MFELKPSKKIFKNYKCDYPSNTIKRLEDAFSKLKIHPIYNSRQVSSAHATIYNGIAQIPGTEITSNGKGTSRILAKASAYAELAERFSAVALRPYVEELPSSSLRNRFLDFNFLDGVMNAPQHKLNNCIRIEELIDGKLKLTRKMRKSLLSDSRVSHWVNAYSLDVGGKIKVPLKFVFIISGTNGLASGNTKEEAISQAMCEVLERHSAKQLISGKRRFPTIDTRSISDENNKKYIALFKSMGFRLIIKDLSLGKGYPIVGIIVINDRLKNEKNPFLKRYYIRLKVGSSPDIDIALQRCFTEELQGYTRHLYTHQNHFDHSDMFWKHWCLEKDVLGGKSRLYGVDHWYDMRGDSKHLLQKSEVISMKDMPTYVSDDSRDDVRYLISLLKENDYETYILDYTHPVLNFPVAQVIIPGMSDSIEYYEPGWIDEDGINDYEPTVEENIIDYISDDRWTRSPKGLLSLLKILEKHFHKYGCMHMMRVGGEELWLFYLAYRLSLFFDDYEKSIRYFKTIRAIEHREEDVLSKQMLAYLKQRSRGKSYEDALRLVRKKYGKAWYKRIRSAMDDHNLKKVILENPFKERMTKKQQTRLLSWIKTFFGS